MIALGWRELAAAIGAVTAVHIIDRIIAGVVAWQMGALPQ